MNDHIDVSDLPFFDPHDWYWLVGSDETRAWSSATAAWVPASAVAAGRVTRIASEAELGDVLRGHGLRGPVVTADDVRAEASRRMQALVGARDAAHLQIIIVNGLREATRLQEKRLEHLRDPSGAPDWTPDEAMRAAELKAVDSAIEALRAASNALEADPPTDYADASRWP